MLDKIFGIEGKTALVIGNTPIGQATVKMLTDAGAIAEMSADNFDATDEVMVSNSFNQFVKTHGRIDILIYAATKIGTYPLKEMTLTQWDSLHDINLRGAFVAVREAVRNMSGSGGGRIVAISTIGSLHPVLHGNAGYGSSKAGLNALIRATALDHAADNILANTVLPGAVPVGTPPSDMVSLGGPATNPGRLLLGMGVAEDIAAAILFLVSPAGKFITGQCLTLDGGFLLA